MIFVSRFSKYRLGLRPTIKQVVHGESGSEEMISHKGVVVEFDKAVFDTGNWKRYTHPESPDRINVIQSEKDLIHLMKLSPYHGVDFFERKEESRADKIAKLRAEADQLEAEKLAEDLNSGKMDNDTEPVKPKGRPKGRPKGKPETKNKESVIEL